MATKQIPDELLVKNYINGDESALAELVNKHQSKVYAFIYRKIRNHDVSNEIFQNTFVKVIKNLKGNGYSEKGKFLSWVFCIAHNLVLDSFKSTKQTNMWVKFHDFSVYDIAKDNSRSIEDKLISIEIQKDITEILNELPKNQREVIEMRMFENLSFKEISGQTGVSVNTALARMRYGIMGMKQIIEKRQNYFYLK